MFPEGLSQASISNFKVFYTKDTASSGSATALNNWQVWNKPLGCSFVYIFALGAGGGGSRNIAGNVLAFGGGGSGGQATALIPAVFLPETLYVFVGRGGLGSASAGVAGANGGPTIVSRWPAASYNTTSGTSTVGNFIVTLLGGTGNQALQTGGAGGAAAAIADGPLATAGIFYSIAGQAGSSGGAATNGAGTALTPYGTGLITSGGAGGSNGTSAGANISAAFPLKNAISGGASGAAGGNGANGINVGKIIQAITSPFSSIFFSGGAGGGGSTSASAAGNGGNASYGGGGGSGGTSNSTGAGGVGGNGGDGLVIIWAW